MGGNPEPWHAPGITRDYMTVKPVVHAIGRAGSGWRLLIPSGREFESSVPRALRWLISPDDPRFLRAALVHDHLLEEGNRALFSAGEWHAAARASGAPWGLALIAALAIGAVTEARQGNKPSARR